MKHCPFCRRELPLSAFPESPHHLGGRSPRCNDCTEGKRPPARPRELNHDEQRPTFPSKPNPWVEEKRRQAEAKQQERQRRPYKRSRPEAIRARKMVARAVEKGELVPLPCEYRFDGCVGSPTEAHHISYASGRELDVKWCCKPCHDKLTAKIRRKAEARKARG